MSFYLFSDVHLRPDRPDRGERLAGWVDSLTPHDSLLVVGDLCDFWMAARLAEGDRLQCPALQALIGFRSRGGELRIMAGNHDQWLCPFYERELGAEILVEPADLTIQGLRVHLVHGHLLGARKRWKSWMESREFHRAFGHVPGPFAGVLDQVLEWKNQRSLLDDEERHLKIYRRYADERRGQSDLVVIGHVHRPVDDSTADPRLVVLGGWQRSCSFLRIDEVGASFHVSPANLPNPPTETSQPIATPPEPR